MVAFVKQSLRSHMNFFCDIVLCGHLYIQIYTESAGGLSRACRERRPCNRCRHCGLLWRSTAPDCGARGLPDKTPSCRVSRRERATAATTAGHALCAAGAAGPRLSPVSRCVPRNPVVSRHHEAIARRASTPCDARTDEGWALSGSCRPEGTAVLVRGAATPSARVRSARQGSGRLIGWTSCPLSPRLAAVCRCRA